jgi:hypothetical protein
MPGHEAMLAVRRGHLPNIKATATSAQASPTGIAENAEKLQGVVREQAGAEYYYQFASRDVVDSVDRQFLTSDFYYAVVISEGQNPAATNRVGTGTVNYTLTSTGQMPMNDETNSPLSQGGPIVSWTGQTVQPGQMKMYRVRVPTGGLDAVENHDQEPCRPATGHHGRARQYRRLPLAGRDQTKSQPGCNVVRTGWRWRVRI